MKKKIEDKLKEVQEMVIRTHDDAIIRDALIGCLESLLVPDKKQKASSDDVLEDMTA